MDLENQLKAISNPTRMAILEWLKEPEAQFPPHKSGRSFDHGVCVAHLQDKAGISQSTASQYLSLLHQAGFVIPTRLGKWTYYQRDEEGIARFIRKLNETMSLTGDPHDRTD